MKDILAAIAKEKRTEVAARKQTRPPGEIERAARDALPARGFRTALKATLQRGSFAVIAEIKRASPSRGMIREDFDPPALARAFHAGGASCLSVLTDRRFFRGHDHYLPQVRAAAPLPVLRKDFLLDTYQVAESRALGADCVLVIMAAVEDALAQELVETARAFGMDALIEVHNERELARASALSPGLIGFNNRNLRDFTISLETTEQLAPLAPKGALLVSESGLSAPRDLARMARCGVRCFLVGERLMRQKDVAQATRALLGYGGGRGGAGAREQEKLSGRGNTEG